MHHRPLRFALGSLHLLFFTFVLAGLGVALPEGEPDPRVPFHGVFNSERVQIEIKVQDAAFAGTLRVDESEMPIAGEIRDGAALGQFRWRDTDFTFEARFDGAVLVLRSDSHMHRLQRKETKPKNPLAPTKIEEQGSLERLFPETCVLEGRYALRHPQGWKLQRSHGLRVLVPGDATELPLLGPLESYALLTTKWKAGRALKDKEGIDLLANQVLAALPFVSRTGDAHIEVIGARTIVKQGFKADLGLGLRFALDAYATVRDGQLVILLAFGEADAIGRRAKTTAQIFQTLHVAAPR